MDKLGTWARKRLRALGVAILAPTVPAVSWAAAVAAPNTADVTGTITNYTTGVVVVVGVAMLVVAVIVRMFSKGRMS